jgi:hypothetical protein
LHNALLLDWESIGPPNRAAIMLKLAHIIVETGLQHCRCWNLGNIKSHEGDGRDWQFFATKERLSDTQLASEAAKAPELVRLVSTAKVGTKRAPVNIHTVSLLPDHPGCRFRAFGSLREGVLDHLGYLRSPKRANVLAALQSGSVERYNHELDAIDYYTEDPKAYLRALSGALNRIRIATASLDWGDVPFTGEG